MKTVDAGIHALTTMQVQDALLHVVRRDVTFYR